MGAHFYYGGNLLDPFNEIYLALRLYTEYIPDLLTHTHTHTHTNTQTHTHTHTHTLCYGYVNIY